MSVKLSDRQQQILWATVRHYIATAKPVGSEALLEEFKLQVSSATVRNAMGRLEKAGLLFQPHVSAGRIPSDSGYRIYVDQLITPSEMAARQVDHALSDQLNWEQGSIEAILRGAAQILATLSGYIALISMPQTRTVSLRHLQFVQLRPQQAMLVVVLDYYETQSVLMPIPAPPTGSQPDAELIDRELRVLSNFLNHHLQGRSIAEISNLDWMELGREFERYSDSLKASLSELIRRSQAPIPTQIVISGVAEVLRRHPEFSEKEQIQTVIQLLEEEQDQLCALILESATPEPRQRRANVWIGSENPLQPINHCALVSATYQRDNVPIGSVGMLGPTRMVYEDAIALVEATADYISEALSQMD
ncbi:MAG: heat-inducible transcriptional repressor HrcA [Synechococcales cyanobacterium T60_A2020_003]|nr:heat-inducible transcriptional repressor HrcA [Synechococcales cyanobacterium T60_A2020_003]